MTLFLHRVVLRVRNNSEIFFLNYSKDCQAEATEVKPYGGQEKIGNLFQDYYLISVGLSRKSHPAIEFSCNFIVHEKPLCKMCLLCLFPIPLFLSLIFFLQSGWATGLPFVVGPEWKKYLVKLLSRSFLKLKRFELKNLIQCHLSLFLSFILQYFYASIQLQHRISAL